MRAPSVDLSPIQELIALIRAECAPTSIWLFGSRATGKARADSDWDLLVVLPDELPAEDMFESLPPRRLRKLSKINADIVYCNQGDFEDAIPVPNTLEFEIAQKGFEIQ